MCLILQVQCQKHLQPIWYNVYLSAQKKTAHCVTESTAWIIPVQIVYKKTSSFEQIKNPYEWVSLVTKFKEYKLKVFGKAWR